MYFKYGYLVGVIFALLGIAKTENGVHKPDLYIFYETLDPPSIKFFSDNFDSNSTKLYSNFVNLHFVPFGKMKVENGTEPNSPFIRNCEHGLVECYGNMQHACALKNAQRPEDAMSFIVCTMSHTDPKTLTTDTESYPTKQCREFLKDLNESNIDICMKATHENVMEEYQNLTLETIGSTVSTLPVITLGKVYDPTLSKEWVSNFHKALCTKFANTTGIEKICADLIPHTDSTPTSPKGTDSSATMNSVMHLPLVLAAIVLVLFNIKLH